MSRPRLAAAAVPFAFLGLSLSPLAAQDDAPDVEAETEAAPLSKGEARLAKLLDGRVAGEPQSCIRSDPRQRSQTIDGTAYVYGSGNTIYVQRTRHPDSINDRDALVINRFSGNQLCRVDIATTIDPVTGIFTGVVQFDDFVPYTRVKVDAPGEG
jgi:hypothetical protein